jgi:hypothetical protein
MHFLSYSRDEIIWRHIAFALNIWAFDLPIQPAVILYQQFLDARLAHLVAADLQEAKIFEIIVVLFTAV